MKKLAPMWHVNDVLYHYSDKERADRMGEAKLVWVVMSSDYFIGTVQLEDNFKGNIFNTEEEAESMLSR